jgi:hypothetical protein
MNAVGIEVLKGKDFFKQLNEFYGYDEETLRFLK